MRLFDVLGPVMIGPSSSHTAGAARIGYTAQKLLGEIPAQADIGLYGSFATTGKGHGTDKALVAGLLGLRPDDPRLPDSFALAAEQGMAFRIHPVELRSAHPNTCLLYTSPLKNANTEGENCDIIKTIKDKTESVLSRKNTKGGELYGTVSLQALWHDPKRRKDQ